MAAVESTDYESIRRELMRMGLISADLELHRASLSESLQVNPVALEELLAAFCRKQSFRLEDLLHFERDLSNVTPQLESIARERGIHLREIRSEDAKALRELILDARIKSVRLSHLIDAPGFGPPDRSKGVIGEWFWPAAIVGFLFVAILIFSILRTPAPPASAGPGPRDTEQVSTVSWAGNGWFLLSAVLIFGGTAIFLKGPPKVGKPLGALLALSGLSLFPIKEAKLFETLFGNVNLQFTRGGGTLQLESNLESCTINPFGEGNEEPDDKDKAKIATQIGSCSKQIEGRGSKLAFVLVIGHADKRELLIQPRKIYGSNAAIAYRRALWVGRHFFDGQPAEAAKTLKTKLVYLSAGPEHVGENPVSGDLALDRTVEVIPYWIDVAAQKSPAAR